jgi:hypothetical protein
MGIRRLNAHEQSLVKQGAKCVSHEGEQLWPVIPGIHEGRRLPTTQIADFGVLAKPKSVPPKSEEDVGDRTDWEPILRPIASECLAVYEKRGSTAATVPWFVRWCSVPDKVLTSVKTLKPQGLNGMKDSLPFDFETDEEYLQMAGRLHVRLMDMSSRAFCDLRAWYGRIQDQTVWVWGLPLLAKTRWGSVSDPEELLATLDTYHTFVRSTCHVPSTAIAELVRDDFGTGWDLMPLSSILSFAKSHGLHWVGVLRMLWQKELEHCREYKAQPSILMGKLARHLLKLTTEEMQRIPKVEDAATMEWLDALGLPAGVQMPKRLPFGLDCRKLNRSDAKLIRISEGGQAVYQLANGTVSSEGNPIPRLSVVTSWGKAIQIWVTAENFKEVARFWYAPPPHCPWSWYKLWGDGQYLEDGKAVHPDPKFRPPVTWLEMTGKTVEEWSSK